MAILAVVAMLSLGVTPAAADDGPTDRLVEVGLRDRVVQLVADGDSTCALTEAGDVYCWGAGYPQPYRRVTQPSALIWLGALLVSGGVILMLLSRSSPRARRPAPESPPA